MKPRILLITNEIPYPLDKSGQSITITPILNNLHAEYDIDLLFPISNKNEPDPQYIEELKSLCSNVLTFEHSYCFATRLLCALFHPLPLVFKLYSEKKFINNIFPLIEEHIDNYKAILLQDTHLARFIDNFDSYKNIKKILISGDYFSLLYKRISESSNNVFSKFYHWISYKKLRRYEPRIYQKFDTVIFVSSKDKRSFSHEYPKLRSKIVAIPLSIDVEKYSKISPRASSSSKSLLYTGNMNYVPNRQAVSWFYDNVFRVVRKKCPGITWDIVGRDAGNFITINDPQVFIHSSVPSINPYVKDATMVISPLQSGAGLKIKVLEAMACGKVVIGSELSFEGINISNKKHAIIAPTAEEYISQIEKYINNQSERKLIEKNAQQLIRTDFNILNNVKKWKQVIEGSLEG